MFVAIVIVSLVAIVLWLLSIRPYCRRNGKEFTPGAAFEAQYPVRFVSYSSSSEGACIRVRKDQYSEEMASYVTDLIKKQD